MRVSQVTSTLVLSTLLNENDTFTTHCASTLQLLRNYKSQPIRACYQSWLPGSYKADTIPVYESHARHRGK